MAESLWTDLLGVSFAQKYYDVGGVRTRVLEAGSSDKPPLIFLHGVNGHAEAYARNIGPHAERFHVFSMDMIGHGFTDKPLDRSYEIATYVEHLTGFLDTLGFQRAHISGESLGGWVATRFALEKPERVDRLVLNTPGGLTAFPKVMERLYTLTLDAVREPSREKVRKRLEWLFKDPATVTDDLLETRYRIYTQPGYREVTEKTVGLQVMEIRQRNMLTDADLRRLSIPVMVVWTTADPAAGLDTAYRWRDNIPNSRLVVLENSGHWPQFEEPDAFNKVHIDFLEGRSAAVREELTQVS
jgi:2-hydroxy-6-oxonona-2,4-dienedioate hydrolase